MTRRRRQPSFTASTSDNGTADRRCRQLLRSADTCGSDGADTTFTARSRRAAAWPTPAALVVGIDPGFRNPRSLQTAGTVEQEIKPQFTLSLPAICTAATWRLQRRLDENLSPPAVEFDGPSDLSDSRGQIRDWKAARQSILGALRLRRPAAVTSQISRRSRN